MSRIRKPTLIWGGMFGLLMVNMYESEGTNCPSFCLFMRSTLVTPCDCSSFWCPLHPYFSPLYIQSHILKSWVLCGVSLKQERQSVCQLWDDVFYVDDFVIMYTSPTIDAIQRKLQHTINRLKKWTVKNGFTFSKNKTVAMHFCPDKKMHGSCFEIGQWPYPACKRS